MLTSFKIYVEYQSAILIIIVIKYLTVIFLFCFNLEQLLIHHFFSPSSLSHQRITKLVLSKELSELWECCHLMKLERTIERRLIKENLKTYFMEIGPKGLILSNGFPSGSISKESTCNIEGCLSCRRPGSGRSLEEEMTIYSRILAWELPGKQEPGRL